MSEIPRNPAPPRRHSDAKGLVVGVLAGVLALALAAVLAVTLSEGGGSSNGHGGGSTRVPAYVTVPFTEEQKLIAQGAHLVVSDGCAACHLQGAQAGVGPNFNDFAGHQVTLRGGRSVLVNESYIREGLLNPVADALADYDPAPMLAALAPLHLAGHPQQVAALAAFIEQVGPETE